jgi:hypothetical protein
MRRAFCLALTLFAGAGALRAAAAPQVDLARAIELEVEQRAGPSALWPGFEPRRIPLAIYVGEGTYLFRHPSPPAGFSRVESAGVETYRFEGRHPAVTSNSSAEIGGTVTATLLADGARGQGGPVALAATALHEAFHVDQRKRHPTWIGNEADVFVYPTDDASILAWRRLESAALGRALATGDGAGAACWARAALGFRRQRFAAMAAAFSTYERASELNEGLAAYVQLRAAGERTVEIPASEFPAAGVRQRVYVSGPALAVLLDRLRPGWQGALEADDHQFLDLMLEQAAVADPAARPCELGPAQAAEIGRVARRDVAALVAERDARRRAFDARPGWRIVIEAADGKPLWPQGFDPLNVERAGAAGTAVLHGRFVVLANDAGEIRVIDEEVADLETLTEGVGPHPLFNGVRRATVAGLARPQIERAGGAVTVRAPGCTARFVSAVAEVSRRQVLVRLRDAKQ